MDRAEVGQLQRLSVLSADFDQSLARLRFMLAGERDACVGARRGEGETDSRDAITRLSEAVGRMEQEIRGITAALSNDTAGRLMTQLRDILSRTATVDAPATPPKQMEDVVPQAETPSSAGQMDLEAFPSTPTLQQLGLSGRTMALVGRGSDALSSYSVSDCEYESSFLNNFHRSPAVVSKTMDNSFSSDMSAPNFRIMHSSPSLTDPSLSFSHGTGHNLMKVTHAGDDSLDENSSVGNNSFMMVDESDLVRKVHFRT